MSEDYYLVLHRPDGSILERWNNLGLLLECDRDRPGFGGMILQRIDDERDAPMIADCQADARRDEAAYRELHRSDQP